MLTGLVLVFMVVLQWPSKNLKVVFCDVGQGDASLVVLGRVQVLIDGGPSSEALLECLSSHMPFWDREIEMVVSTHPDQDHIGGLPEVLRRYKVGTVLAGEKEGAGKDAKDFKELVKRMKKHSPRAGEKIKVGQLEFIVLWPNLHSEYNYETEGIETNTLSIVLFLKYGEFRAMFTGDIGSEEEAMIPLIPESVVLKVAHHGSKHSSSDEFLKAVKPKLAVIEVGRKNRYGHPTQETLGKLSEVGAKILRTDIDGEVVIMSDGRNWW